MIDRLKRGRDKEKECAKAMAASAQIKAWWIPPRAQYAKIADNTGQDVFGVFDFVGVDWNGAVVGVQVCRKRPGELAIRKAKIATFVHCYLPAMRAIVAYYDKSGFMLEELMPDFVWRLKALLPYEKPLPEPSLPLRTPEGLS